MPAEQQHDGERQSDLAVMDANEYKQKRRLERILDALEGVEDTADKAWQQYSHGEIDRDAFNITIQRAVKKAIRECDKLLKDHARSTDGDDRYYAGNPREPIALPKDAPGLEDMIVGLNDFLQSDQYNHTEIEMEKTRRNKPNRTVVERIESTLPAEISFKAYLRLNEFLDDQHDMEISFEELDDKLADRKPTTVETEDRAGLERVIELAEEEGIHVDKRALDNGAD